uniref:Peptidase M16 middle/third domain-containing protein n=1 Tax=Corethron hystrix TaxID=216773 RepID=A0A7S1BFN2_9STRA|mmetsp:Transcript_24250/g.55223  ORF Transcript_24250/g.55223 Transcript_24250/m.55223 type:complete len:345 (+) Transcript_24250:240-1274(+)
MRVTKDNRIGPPTPNPLVPVRPLPPRPIVKHMAFDGTMRYYFLDGAAPATSSRSPDSHTVWREFLTAPNANAAVAKDLGPDWKLLTNPTSFNRPPPYPALPLPVLPPESTCRCAFMLQLLSPRPARADVRQGAHAELWLLSFETAIADLADLGAPGGLAYDVTFNKFGLRVCFLGIAQNLPSYARRFCRRLVRHAGRMEGSAGPTLLSTEVLDLAVTRARRLSQASKPRRRQIIRELVGAEPSDAGSEGSNFLQSCGGAVCLAQGDLLPGEAAGLTAELREIFQGYISEYHGDDGPHPLASLRPPVFPDLEEIVYRPMWKPRGASPCSIAGGALISDPCGRVRR